MKVGLTKSVFVTLIFEGREMAMPELSLLVSYKNLVYVWVVLQGRGQSDTWPPTAKPRKASNI